MDSVLEKGSGLQKTWSEMKIRSERFAQQKASRIWWRHQIPIFSQNLEISSAIVAKFRVKP